MRITLVTIARTSMFCRMKLTMALVLGALAMSLVAFADAQGQAGPRRGGGDRAGRAGDTRSTPDGGAAEKRFEEMASLEQATKGIDGLTKVQKDSLRRIESHYGENLTGYGRAARRLVDSVSDSTGPLNVAAMRRLQKDAEALRDDEFAEARAVLGTDAQRARFDANVTALRDIEAKRDEERGSRIRERLPRAEGVEERRPGPPNE